RGFGAEEFTEVADIIATALIASASSVAAGSTSLGDSTAVELRARVTALAEKFPLYPHLSNDAEDINEFEADLIGAAQ
ncbi:MAG: serine hydroxymethyltransferase, partial [Arthrobacter sp.]|nr:serine hydroxymethyltransferase [Arthrobacter sp.]